MTRSITAKSVVEKKQNHKEHSRNVKKEIGRKESKQNN
jgi:hypothetical protein